MGNYLDDLERYYDTSLFDKQDGKRCVFCQGKEKRWISEQQLEILRRAKRKQQITDTTLLVCSICCNRLLDVSGSVLRGLFMTAMQRGLYRKAHALYVLHPLDEREYEYEEEPDGRTIREQTPEDRRDSIRRETLQLVQPSMQF